MEDTDKKPFDDIDGGIIHHVGEQGNYPQNKTRVNFAAVKVGKRRREEDVYGVCVCVCVRKGKGGQEGRGSNYIIIILKLATFNSPCIFHETD